MKNFFVVFGVTLFFFGIQNSFSQSFSDSSKTVTVHFLHGSKPAKGEEQNEAKWFGGLHGGHVYLQIDSILVSFYPKSGFHVFPHKKERHSLYHREKYSSWSKDTVEMQYTSITIPITIEQYSIIRQITEDYLIQTPYDYAFFGMRCASAANDILGQVGIVKARTRSGHILFNFYPKPFRKKLLKTADKKGHSVKFKKGRETRKWEK